AQVLVKLLYHWLEYLGLSHFLLARLLIVLPYSDSNFAKLRIAAKPAMPFSTINSGAPSI
ncbi:MAG: hypothetical protein ACFCBU_15840, partial [Cyanophyceae cyanobacterium]